MVRGPMMGAVTAGVRPGRKPGPAGPGRAGIGGQDGEVLDAPACAVLGLREVVPAAPAWPGGWSCPGRVLAEPAGEPAAGQRAPRDDAHAVAAGRSGSTAASMPRVRMEYGGCSVRNRWEPRRSAAHWASTISSAGNVERAERPDLAAWTRSDRAPRVSPSPCPGRTGGSGTGRCSRSRSRRRLFSHLGDDPAAGVAPWFRSSPIGPCDLGGQHDPSRRPVNALPTISSDSPRRVDIGSVDDIDPGVEARGMIADRPRDPGCPRPEHHRAQTHWLTLMPVLPPAFASACLPPFFSG